MELGELFFKWLHSGKLNRQSRHFARFEMLDIESSGRLDRLELLCRSVTENAARVHLTDGLEIPEHTALFLPRFLGLGTKKDENFSVYLYRVMAFHGAIRDGLTLAPDYSAKPDLLMRSALVAPSVHRQLAGHYSGFPELLNRVRAIIQSATAAFSDYDSRFSAWAELSKSALSMVDFALDDDQTTALAKLWREEWLTSPFCPLLAIQLLPRPSQGTQPAFSESTPETMESSDALPRTNSAASQEIRLKTVARPRTKVLNQEQENPLTHVFEKLLTADEHRGGSKTPDGSDESVAHADALAELTLDSVVRTQAGADSIAKSSAHLDSSVPDLEATALSDRETTYSYPEWFEEHRRYKSDFCTIYESETPPTREGESLDIAEGHSGLSEKLSSFLNEARWKPRQKDGVDLDLDAIVRWRSQLHGMGPVDQRLFLGKRHLERNLAILILLDSSLSSDAWVGDKRVLDIMRSSIAIIGEAFDGLDDRFAIAAFNSYSRTRCNFKWVKRFDDLWPTGRLRLNSLRPEAYTRIGPALRHAHAIMNDIRARRKLILLFSDAKPSDYDRYEGAHGRSDVRKAALEIKARGIFLRGITVAQTSRANLTHMFGAGQYQVLSDPLQIADKVLRIFIELMRQR